MSNLSPQSFLENLLAREFEAHKHAKSHLAKPHPPLVLTLSRDYGALGEEIAACLSQCLGIPLYDQDILDRVAQHAKGEAYHFKAHDEQVSAGLSGFLYSLMRGSAVTVRDYRRHLYDVVLDVARKDCILIGRGAHLILADKPVLRVRIVGSKKRCGERISEQFGCSQAEAEQKVHEINRQRHESVLNLFGEHIENCSLELAKNFDLVINTDHLTVEGAVAVILLAMREMGFDWRNPKGDKA
jgi:hypothetical protein